MFSLSQTCPTCRKRFAFLGNAIVENRKCAACHHPKQGEPKTRTFRLKRIANIK